MSIPITEYRNAKVINEDGTRVDVEINHPEYGWIPYTLDTSDTDMTIDNSALLTLIGSDKEAYVPLSDEELAAILAAEHRELRDFYLAEMDTILSNPLRWASMTTEQQNAWTTYRQALLDVPAQSGFPDSVTWPEKPSL
tara:strand:+ start:1246 stop:1662 length:417 start_codon:yes stop_codon:yes gene_type:complete